MHRFYFRVLLVLGMIGLTSEGSFAQVRINEFAAANGETIYDEDGDSSDWVELYNAGDQPVNLAGWSLTNDPRDPRQWIFPETTLDPGTYRVIFASGKNRRDPEGQLHTNFRLNAAGEYLALAGPDGFIEQSFAPQYPSQEVWHADISYGLTEGSDPVITPDTAYRWHVPQNDALGTAWREPGFDDQAWSMGRGGLGYSTGQGDFSVTVYYSDSLEIDSLDDADRIIRAERLRERTVTETHPVINFSGNTSGGNYDDNLVFPGQSEGEDANDFVVVATGTVSIPESGQWTFGLNTDDGARLRIDGEDVIVDDNLHSPRDSLATIELEAGIHTIEALLFERGGGAVIELFAARGSHSSFAARNFHLVGDTESGGLALAGFSSQIDTAVETMQGQASSLYARIPFRRPGGALNALRLTVNHNDGFAAFLNGEEIARRNAPNQLAWNSTAPNALPVEDPVAQSVIALPLSQIEDQLTEENVLAIHLLNASTDDDNALLSVTMDGIQDGSMANRYFAVPTPGEPNNEGVAGFVAKPDFSQAHGFYDAPLTVRINTETADAQIRYTTDGRTPTPDTGRLYEGPIRIDATTPLRAIAYRSGWHHSQTNTATYIFLDDVLRQRRPDGYPASWGGGESGDYQVDPEVVNHPDYRDTIADDLKSVPSISIVTNKDHLFDSREGIYVNPMEQGFSWERPVSVEFIDPSGQEEGFQVNSGLRIQGGYSRSPQNKKFSFRVFFKRDYGPPRLRYPLFGEDAAPDFDSVILRGGYNYSWHAQEGGFGSNIGSADYLRDEFSRRLLFATGEPSARGRHVHVYLNGLYWGLYNLHERPDEAFSASYMGGEKEEWDVIAGGRRGEHNTRVQAGQKEAWNEMIRLAERGGLDDPERYQEIQQYVDLDSLINYMLTIYYTGNRDAPTVIGGSGRPWNFYSSRRRIPEAGFHFYCWDSEWTLEEPSRNVVTFHNGRDNPARVFNQLLDHPEFRLRVADWVHQHFFNSGVFTPEKADELYASLAENIDRAIVGESARWGDKRFSNPRLRDPHWVNEIERIRETYIPVRARNVLRQLKNANMYPEVPAPRFNQHGGRIQPGFSLTMTLEDETGLGLQERTLVDFEDEWHYRDRGAPGSDDWNQILYDDNEWPSGDGLLYVENSSLPFDKNTPLRLGDSAYYFRHHFVINDQADLEEAQLQLRTVIDDGAIIYLNGSEILRLGMPGGDISHDDFAERLVSNASLEGPFEVPSRLLRRGSNVIAAEVHQNNLGSSDIVFGLELALLTPQPEDPDEPTLPIYFTIDGSDPRLSGGEVNPAALRYRQPITLNQTTPVRARTYDNGEWSALNHAVFQVQQPALDSARLRANLRISEIMYNPSAGPDLEFIELYNAHPSETLSLNGLAFTDGIQFVFPPDSLLPPGGFAVVTPSTSPNLKQQWRDYYGLDSSLELYGPYDGRLANEGERLAVSYLPTGEELFDFTYQDARGWPSAADGAGHSLVPKERAFEVPVDGRLDYGGNWRASHLLRGSPGHAEESPDPSLRLNELATNLSGGDWVELRNLSEEAIGLDNWHLSDDRNNLQKWPLPSIECPPQGRVGMDAALDGSPPFELSAAGGTLFLSYLPGEVDQDRVADTVRYKGQDHRQALSRDAAGYWHLALPSQQAPNHGFESPLLISEIHYHPMTDNPEAAETLEFIEIYNASEETLPLSNAQGPYRLDGLGFTFPEGAAIEPGSCILVVGFDPADDQILDRFLDHFASGSTDLRIMGPYQGRLSNRTERIALEKPMVEGVPADTQAWVIVDEVIYADRAPWPESADGEGASLQRHMINGAGRNPSHWQAQAPSPGQVSDVVGIDAWSLYE
mgnify:CR=1 FL=1